MPCASQHSITSIASCDSRFQPAHKYTRKSRFNGAGETQTHTLESLGLVRGTRDYYVVRPTLTVCQQRRAERAFGRSLNEIVDDSRRPGRWALRHSAVLTMSIHPEANVGD
eukprot:COSAG02_NODE_560_length_20328_cov_15.507343_15_plen_111_part_00